MHTLVTVTSSSEVLKNNGLGWRPRLSHYADYTELCWRHSSPAGQGLSQKFSLEWTSAQICSVRPPGWRKGPRKGRNNGTCKSQFAWLNKSHETSLEWIFLPFWDPNNTKIETKKSTSLGRTGVLYASDVTFPHFSWALSAGHFVWVNSLNLLFSFWSSNMINTRLQICAGGTQQCTKH